MKQLLLLAGIILGFSSSLYMALLVLLYGIGANKKLGISMTEVGVLLFAMLLMFLAYRMKLREAG